MGSVHKKRKKKRGEKGEWEVTTNTWTFGTGRNGGWDWEWELRPPAGSFTSVTCSAIFDTFVTLLSINNETAN